VDDPCGVVGVEGREESLSLVDPDVRRDLDTRAVDEDLEMSMDVEGLGHRGGGRQAQGGEALSEVIELWSPGGPGRSATRAMSWAGRRRSRRQR